jgi:UMF1 family MFS transporter
MPPAPQSRKTGFLESIGLHRKELFSWALYDVANSAFATTIMVAILPVYFGDVVAEHLTDQKATSLWAYISAAATFLTALVSPFLGVVADRKAAKKRLLFLFTTLGALASAGLYFATSGQITLTATLFLIASLSFAAGEVFYESILPHIANDEEIHRTSTSGFALGYLGGGVLLAINLAWITKPDWFGFPDAGLAVRASFVSVGCWWFGFSIPLFRVVAEPPARLTSQPQNRVSLLRHIAIAGRDLAQTLGHLRQYRNAFLFLLAFWFYSDGVGTIMKMSVIYGREVGISSDDLIAAILMVQFVGVPFSFLYGPLAHRYGPKASLNFTLAVYLVITMVAYLMSEAWHFWGLAFVLASVQGGNQALSRSMYSQMIPRHRSSEFFSFYSVSSKFAGIFGPLFFGIIGDITGGSRASIFFISILFIVGFILLQRVNLSEGRQEAQRGEAG